MAASKACERGAEDQTCPIHRPPHGLHALTILDDETIDCLSKPAQRSSAGKHWTE